ncbi:cephalotocin receptor 1-like [Acanthaster planci]|uniref:Cephalotocin receptor 1-like n=1 Tax=Acanthaster planci TaxID=133434 RepID=A0A8B8A2B3_ACAPL|nr:cephalotocin receptor 1-like [Acanthaster planci]XP_022111861.1 cephalotocin receptor 1-like [Acanthaster planci]XP_022111862.1 cephalotocin receptor 1-like [Acanthaster planci]XP_022111863.1 cephalotocin receptor 1-like [Acanthaster planci]XP_022111864.1 cephalotocin receptor 1-like [Acanthaster planci]
MAPPESSLPVSTTPYTSDIWDVNASEDGNVSYELVWNSTSAPSVWYPKRNEELATVEILLSASIFFLALLGNSIVIAVLWRRRKSLSRMHFFIIHLCIADLMVAFFYTLPQMIWDITYKFYGPDFMCRIVKFFQLFPVYLSTYILVMTAIDRYLAICHPLMGLRGNHTLRMRLMVLTAWIISAVCSMPQFWFFRLENRTKGPGVAWMDCRGNFPSQSLVVAYITFFSMAVYVIPSLLLTVMYGLICLTVWMNMDRQYKYLGKKQTAALPQKDNNNWEEDESDKLNPEHMELQQKSATKREGPSDQKPQMLYRRHGAAGKVSRAKVKTVKMTLTIVTMYVTLWAPFFIAQLLSVWAKINYEAVFFTISLLLVSLTSCINPWIYFAFSSNALRDIQQAFGCLNLFRPKNGMSSDRTHHDDNSSRYVSTTGTAAASM